MNTSTLFKEFWRKFGSSATTTTAIDQTAKGSAKKADPQKTLPKIAMSVKAYDLSLLREMVGDNTSAIQEIVQKFVQDTPPELIKLEKAVAANNLPAVGSQAHKLKSHLKLFGLERVTHSLLLLEKVGKGEELPLSNQALLQQHAEEVKAVFEGAIRELASDYPTA